MRAPDDEIERALEACKNASGMTPDMFDDIAGHSDATPRGPSKDGSLMQLPAGATPRSVLRRGRVQVCTDRARGTSTEVRALPVNLFGPGGFSNARCVQL